MAAVRRRGRSRGRLGGQGSVADSEHVGKGCYGVRPRPTDAQESGFELDALHRPAQLSMLDGLAQGNVTRVPACVPQRLIRGHPVPSAVGRCAG
jgi:hypothetical protein